MLLTASVHTTQFVSFDSPIDAVSIGFSTDAPELAIRSSKGWETLVIEKEFDPLLRESNLVIFPKPVTEIVLRGATTDFTVHPIRISHTPASYSVAATTPASTPKILSRRDWGADESYGIEGAPVTRSDEPTTDITASDNGGTPSQRIIDCEQAQKLYPEEFKASAAVKTDAEGNRYRWPQRYSTNIKLLVVHHTAIAVGGDERPGVERMRALYTYHANNRGWGDIGYNFLIDETGQIYEGRAGGDYIVGGHAYCYNVGTLGIALMGNFDEEQPTQEQTKALQWLLDDLAERYEIDPAVNVTFHGKTMPPIVRHKDLLSTDCPGYYMSGAMAQVRTNVIAGNTDAGVTFPAAITKKFVDKTVTRLKERMEKADIPESRRLGRINRLTRTASRINDTTGRQKLFKSVRNAPADTRSTKEQPSRPVRGLQDYSAMQNTAETKSRITNNESQIRIRLTHDGSVARISARDGLTVNGQEITEMRLGRDGDNCVAVSGSRTLAEGIVRVSGNTDITVDSKSSPFNRYAGIIECRIVEGTLTLINELPLDTYLAGLSEEPDTEPVEKQKAFAVAARSYAAFYRIQANRKFPGMPYDGDDSPARFQSYSGVAYAERNPRWVAAVTETSGLVVTIAKQVVKTPYFSADDGRTRSPDEAGWKNFPFAHVFSSKEDPWCEGLKQAGHGVGMSGCGAEGQANEGKTYTQILEYYYPTTRIAPIPQ